MVIEEKVANERGRLDKSSSAGCAYREIIKTVTITNIYKRILFFFSLSKKKIVKKFVPFIIIITIIIIIISRLEQVTKRKERRLSSTRSSRSLTTLSKCSCFLATYDRHGSGLPSLYVRDSCVVCNILVSFFVFTGLVP